MTHTVRVEHFIVFDGNGVGLHQRNNGTEADGRKISKGGLMDSM